MHAGRRRHHLLHLIHALTVIALLLGSSALTLPDSAAQEATPAATADPTQPIVPGTDPAMTPSPDIASPTITATTPAAPPSSGNSTTPAPTSTTAPAPTATNPPPSPTATAMPRATSTPAQVGVAATTGALTIKPVDIDGNPVLFTCFDIYLDAGGGSLGTLTKSGVCDYADSGLIQVRLTFGSYVLVETRHPADFGTALKKPFTINSDRTLTVTHQRPTRIIVTNVDPTTGQPVPGGCYRVEPQTPIIIPPATFTCDGSDEVWDGITTIIDVDRGTYALTEVQPPTGYLTAASVTVTVSTLSSPRSITVAHDKGATLLIHKQTESGQPLAGVCFTLLANDGDAPGPRVGSDICDNHDGTDDGTITGLSIETGDYFLHEVQTPAGYLPVADLPVTLTAGQTTELTITDPAGGRIEIRAVDDHGNPVPDICPVVFERLDGSRGDVVPLPPCQMGTDQSDGISTLIGLPTGAYLLAQSVGQWRMLVGEYVPSADVPVTITAGTTKAIQVVNPIGGKLVVTTIDKANPGTRVLGICHVVYADAGGGARGAYVGDFCEGLSPYDTKDGVATLSGLAAGSYVLAQRSAPALFNLAPDLPFTIGLGEVKNVTVANPPYGKIRILKKTPEGAALPGSCFIASYGPGSGSMEGNWASATVCDKADGADDGTVQISLPNGTFVLQEQTAPAGYVRAPHTTAELRNGGVTDVTIVDPLPSTLVLSFVDVWGDPVPGLCVDSYGTNSFFGGLPGGGGCDPEDGATDGAITLSGLTWGTWHPIVGNPGRYTMPETFIQLSPGESKTVGITLTEAQPVITVLPRIDGLTQTSFTVYWETDQKMISAVTYGTPGGESTTVPESPGAATRVHRVTITGLAANTVYSVHATPTSPNGDITGAELRVRTLPADLTGQVVASMVRSDATSLPGACLSVYWDTGGGVAGSFVRKSCDWADEDGNNGTITINGLAPGSYVLIQFYTARYYKVAKPVLFSLTSGQSKRVTIINTRGGVVLRVTSRAPNGPYLMNTCFAVYRDPGDGTVGAYVTDVCDGLDATDGVTTFTGIGPGNYYLWQIRTPSGYIGDPIKKFSVLSGQTNRYITYYSRSLTDTENVVLKAVDSTGALKPGACFWLYTTDVGGDVTGFVADACDGDDGRNDGLTYFTHVRPDRYAALEYAAPRGYVSGKIQYFTKVTDTLYSKRITQVAGGTAVKVTTLTGGTSTKLPGACYGVYHLVKTNYVAMGVACDSWDGTLDGVTIIRGIPAGTYRLYQNGTPAGYKAPAYVTVTVGTTTKGVTVRTYPR